MALILPLNLKRIRIGFTGLTIQIAATTTKGVSNESWTVSPGPVYFQILHTRLGVIDTFSFGRRWLSRGMVTHAAKVGVALPEICGATSKLRIGRCDHSDSHTLTGLSTWFPPNPNGANHNSRLGLVRILNAVSNLTRRWNRAARFVSATTCKGFPVPGCPSSQPLLRSVESIGKRKASRRALEVEDLLALACRVIVNPPSAPAAAVNCRTATTSRDSNFKILKTTT
ncbi:hypothetical protein AJ78_02532 [Emergomyces pasteurianus Ep9510]|uniref:Uncharacterized protein n=1 Tax=Emergomyces pasteurianus Ep9510 TaxID=1447872 RepID=A0A1J9QAT4_9EURO|nr:hypothetical protein AJ78_02532 [Emergomyces pasteurianus Ep9510]